MMFVVKEPVWHTGQSHTESSSRECQQVQVTMYLLEAYR